MVFQNIGQLKKIVNRKISLHKDVLGERGGGITLSYCFGFSSSSNFII